MDLAFWGCLGRGKNGVVLEGKKMELFWEWLEGENGDVLEGKNGNVLEGKKMELCWEWLEGENGDVLEGKKWGCFGREKNSLIVV